MKKIMMRLFIGFFVLLCLPLSFLLDFTHVQASTKKIPVTSLQTIPGSPQGNNGWFDAVTLIELDSHKTGTTFFQWNTTSGEWKRYKTRIRAWRGENTLYYYSISQGVAEPVKSKVIKVDYQKPVIESITSTSENGKVNLSWHASSDATSFVIYKQDNGKLRTIAQTSQNTYVDEKVIPGKLSVYTVKAVDGAGWYSDKISTQIIASAVVTPAPSKIAPRIAGGSVAVLPSTQSVFTPKAPEPESNNEVNEPTPLATQKEVPSNNWNRLLVAISILVIATGAAIGSYYGYAWWISRGDEEAKPKKKISRW